MCKGATMEESRNRGGVCRLPPGSDMCAVMISCELCDSRASLYCQADDAYLCRKCDRWVHGANFLAQRHVRCFLCSTCQKLTPRYRVGVSAEVVLPSLVSSAERSQCDNSGAATANGTDSSRTLKRPFLFL